jgi:uncharacterized protein YjbI with pentapeptide repeats
VRVLGEEDRGMARCNELCTKKEAPYYCALCEALAERDRFERFWFKGGVFIDGLYALNQWWRPTNHGEALLVPPKGIEPASVPQQGLWERTERLRGAADETARLTQAVYLSFLALGTYIAIIIGSTTDMQLLKVSPVTLPLLNVQLPIVEFYVIVPWLLLLVYFNVLLHLAFLADKLYQFNTVIANLTDAAAREEQRLRVFPFPFSALRIDRPARGSLRTLLSLMVVTTVVLLPLILLLWTQVRFLPYHNTAITWWSHRLAVLVDIALLWLFWPLLFVPAQERAAAAPLFPLGREEQRQRATQRIARTRRLRWWTGLVCMTLVTIVFSLGIAVLPEEVIEVWMASHLPRVLVHTEFARMNEKPPTWPLHLRTEMSVFKVTFWLFEGPGALFHRNLQLKEQVLVAGEPTAEVIAALRSNDETKWAQGLEKITGLILTNRDLRGADLRDTLFPKVDLRGANLKGVRLTNARIFAGNFSVLQIPWGNRCVGTAKPWGDGLGCLTNLQGAYLRFAELRGADFREAQLQGAFLEGAQLQGALLAAAQLQGAYLRYAQLQGASLVGAQLQGAFLVEAHLQGALLVGAQLQGAFLAAAQLQGAFLEGAQLQGAFLKRANIGSADFRNADLTWSNLEGFSQSLLDDQTYWELKKILTDAPLPDALSDTRVRAARLKLLQNAVGRPTNLSASSAQENSVLCDNAELFRSCVTQAQRTRYMENYGQFLATLACKGKDRLIIHIIECLYFVWLEVETEQFTALKAFAKYITTSLEKDCPGWAALSADAKDSLRTLAAGENSVPK